MSNNIDKAVDNAIANINIDNLNVTKEQIELIKNELKNNQQNEMVLNKLVEISENSGIQKKYGK